MVPCVRCHGRAGDCKACHGTGYDKVTQCPYRLITPDAHDVLQAVSVLRNHGGWFRGNGWGNETQISVQAIQAAMGDEETLKAEALKH